jgi:hypothetical protein
MSVAPFAPKHSVLVLSALFGRLPRIAAAIGETIRRLEVAEWSISDGVYTLADCYVERPPSGSAHHFRVVALQGSDPSTTLLAANLADGWSSLAHILSKSEKIDALILGFSDDTEACLPGAFLHIFI